MGVIEIVILALGLSMDAFAVSVCRGLSLNKITFKDMFIAGIWFGGFQALMTAAGFFLGSTLSGLISDFDHWIAFIILCFLGLNMIKEGLEDGFGNGKKKETEVQKDSDRKSVLGFKTMFFLAVATSIDALATGITLAFLNVGILFPAFVMESPHMTTLVIGLSEESNVSMNSFSEEPIESQIMLRNELYISEP